MSFLYTKNNLKYFCGEHNELVCDSHMFKHLRRMHGAESGGKAKIRQRGVDTSPLTIELSSYNVREIFIRELNVKFNEVVRKLKRLDVFDDVEPTFFSKRIPPQDVMSLHVIVINIPSVRVRQCDEIPFDVPLSVLRAPAVFDVKSDEFVIESLVYSLENLLGQVSPVFLYVRRFINTK